MIKVIIPHVETDICLDSDFVQTLTIENPKEFYRTVEEFIKVFNGEESNVCFVECDKELSAYSGEIVLNPITIDFNDKKLLNVLYKKFEKDCNNGSDILKLNEINSLVDQFLQDSVIDFPAPLDYGEISICEIFKAVGLKFGLYFENLLEKIISYINILIELKNIKFIIFVNLKSYISNEELDLLARHCANEKVSLFLIESAKTRELLSNEKGIIITEDLCEIVENCGET